MSNRRLTVIPPDLEFYPPEHIINLLRMVAAERDELYLELQNEQARSANAAAAAAAAVSITASPPFQNGQNQGNPTNSTNAYGFGYGDVAGQNQNNNMEPLPATAQLPQLNAASLLNQDSNKNDETESPSVPYNELGSVIPPSFKVDAVKKRIAKKSMALVKKTPHNKTKKPYVEINEAVPGTAAALALFEGYAPKSDTSRLVKWEMTGEEVIEWLGSSSKFIHPVKFDGKVIAFGGSKPFVYAWASYDSCQAKFDKKGSSLWLKFRTKMVGSGRPEEGSNSPPSLAC